MALDLIEVKRTLESLNASHGAGKVFYVCPDGASETYRSDFIGIQKVAGQVHSTVASAVSSCVSNRGDIVVVFPGTYTQTGGAVTLDKNGMTLMGLPGRRDMTLLQTGVNSEQAADVTGFNTINVMGDGCTIKDLTISNGWANDAGKTRICIGSLGEAMTVSGCKLTFDTAAASCMTGIYLSKGNAKILDCHFEDTMSGSAIVMDADGGDIVNVLIKGCYFVGVNASAKLALHVTDSANDTTNLVVTECLFSTNGAGGAAESHFYDLANGGAGDAKGLLANNVFTVASIDTAAQMGAKDATVLMVRNWGIDGVSAAIPS